MQSAFLLSKFLRLQSQMFAMKFNKTMTEGIKWDRVKDFNITDFIFIKLFPKTEFENSEQVTLIETEKQRYAGKYK